jgi:ureidoacrylate peracid hydrolase
MEPIALDAAPAPFPLDTEEAALLIVDMQNDFGSEGGMFHRHGNDISGIQRAAAAIAAMLPAVRDAGLPVVYLKMGYHPDLRDLGDERSTNRARHLRTGVGETVETPRGKGRTLIRDTWCTDIVDSLAPEAGDVVLYKHRYSGFYETGLDASLRARGIRQLVVAGCTTSVCVESTIRDAYFRDYQVLLLTDCCAEPIGARTGEDNHAATIALVRTLFGWTADSAALQNALGAPDQAVREPA